MHGLKILNCTLKIYIIISVSKKKYENENTETKFQKRNFTIQVFLHSFDSKLKLQKANFLNTEMKFWKRKSENEIYEFSVFENKISEIQFLELERANGISIGIIWYSQIQIL